MIRTPKGPVAYVRPKGPLAGFDVDERLGAPPVELQLKNALKKVSAKILDLFRSWDSNGDGVITRAEFHKAMPELGLNVSRVLIDELFSSWQNDEDGELAFSELVRILRAPSITDLVRKALGNHGSGKHDLKALSKYFEDIEMVTNVDGGTPTVNRHQFDTGLVHLLGAEHVDASFWKQALQLSLIHI